MAVLGSRLLEDQKKVGETSEAILLRQSGENSVLRIAQAVVKGFALPGPGLIEVAARVAGVSKRC
jgi:hypothetical protein